MSYKQSVMNVKMVIIHLDSGLFNLNMLRFKYIENIFKKYNVNVTIDEYVDSIQTFNTMYSSMDERIDNKELFDLVEKNVYRYVMARPNIVKDGVEELLHFLDQKKIHVAVVSSFKAKRAVQYLQLTNLYKYVDFVIGGDSNLSIADGQMYNKIIETMNVPSKESLVVANDSYMVAGANFCKMPVVYIEDLIKDSNQIKDNVYQIAKNNLDLINVLLFAKYDDLEIYSNILGFTTDMTKAMLKTKYLELINRYRNDEDLLSLVERTYQHYNSLCDEHTTLKEETIIDNDEKKKDRIETNFEGRLFDTVSPVGKSFSFNDEGIKEKNVEALKPRSSIIDSITPLQKGEYSTETPAVHQGKTVTNTICEPQKKSDSVLGVTLKEKTDVYLENQGVQNVLTDDFKQQASSLSEMIDQINNESSSEVKKDNIEHTSHLRKADFNEYNKDYKNEDVVIESATIIDIVFDGVINSILFVFVCLVLRLVFLDYINDITIIKVVVDYTFGLFVQFIQMMAQVIVDSLHAVISSIPNYQTLQTGDYVLSSMAVELILSIICIALIYIIINVVILKIKKGDRNAKDIKTR